jgi:hypothetical protein
MAQASPVPPKSQPGGQTAAPQKQRSPAEKVVVWGGILLLLVLVGVQARARLGYSKTLQALQDRMAEDEGANANPLFVKDLGNFVYGWPSQKDESKGKHLSTIELTWTGLPMTKPLGLVVGYDPEEAGGTVMALETRGFVEGEQGVAPHPFTDEEVAEIGPNLPPGAAGAEPAGDEPSPEPQSASEPAAEPTAATPEPAPTEPAATEPAAPTEPAATPEPAATEPAPAEQPAAETPATEAPATTEPPPEKPADK